MAKNRIEINGSIDRYSYSAHYFRYMLKNCEDGPITVIVNSYGGDVNEALNIGNQIADHGDVTVEYVAFNASAATLLGLYSKHSRINSDALYLIHKTSVWIDAWGQMNEDQIEDAIKDLQEQKKTAEVSTLVLAKCFCEKSGKSLQDILSMMKNAKWMTAEEVVEAGFVDEVVQSKCKKKPSVSNDLAAIFSANGIPLPETVACNDPEDEKDRKPLISTIANAITEGFKSLKHNSKSTMNKQFICLNKLLNVEGFDVQDNAVSLAVEQLTAFNTAIETGDQAKKDLEASKTETDNAKNDLNTMVNSLDGLDDSVKKATDTASKIAAIKALLDKKPGVQASTQMGNDNHDVKELSLDPVNNFFNE